MYADQSAQPDEWRTHVAADVARRAHRGRQPQPGAPASSGDDLAVGRGAAGRQPAHPSVVRRGPRAQGRVPLPPPALGEALRRVSHRPGPVGAATAGGRRCFPVARLGAESTAAARARAPDQDPGAPGHGGRHQPVHQVRRRRAHPEYPPCAATRTLSRVRCGAGYWATRQRRLPTRWRSPTTPCARSRTARRSSSGTSSTT